MLSAQTATVPSGSGTSGDPYRIASLNNLYWISQNASSWSGYFLQTANIDASATSSWDSGAGWAPIGSMVSQTNYTAFTGSYNGQGYTISGLFINRPSKNSIGLWGCISGSANINNLGLLRVNITGNYDVGGLIGYNVNSNVSNCYVNGSIRATTNRVGGLIGSNGGKVFNCSVRNNDIDSISGSIDVAGLIGYNYSTVHNCYAIANINGDADLGGLIGYNGSKVTDCYAISNISGVYLSDTILNSSNIGGLVGFNSDTINNCNATGKIISGGWNDYQIGGLIGLNSCKVTNCHANEYIITGRKSGNVGGLIGLSSYEKTTIYNCYATGDISVGYLCQDIGGLIGKSGNGSGIVDRCYATGNVISRNCCSSDVGSLIGENYDIVSNCYARGNVIGMNTICISGLIGVNWSQVSYCYATGNVSNNNSSFIGGLIGYNNKYNDIIGKVNDSFWDTASSGQSNGYGGQKDGAIFSATGKTTSEMKTQSTYTDAGWNFTSIWNINESNNDGYPCFIGSTLNAVVETKVDNIISLCPNPTTKAFQLNGIEGTATITISDLNGRLLLTKEVTLNETVSINKLPNGIYLVSIKSKNTIETKKLVIQR